MAEDSPAHDLTVETWDRLRATVAERPAAVAADRGRAPKLLAELLAAPSREVREFMVVYLERFRSIALAEILVERSFERRASALELAELALAILELIDPTGGLAAVVDPLRVRAWGAVAEAWRSRGDVESAKRAFERAFLHLLWAPDPLEEGLLLRLLSRLCRDQGNLPSAIALQRRSVARTVRFARSHLAAEAWLELAGLYLHGLNTPCAMRSLYAALGVLASESGSLP